jgi:hypothetical protein
VERWERRSSTREINRLLERLTNLMYLIRKQSTNSSKVEFYVGLAEETLTRINALTHDPEDPSGMPN